MPTRATNTNTHPGRAKGLSDTEPEEAMPAKKAPRTRKTKKVADAERAEKAANLVTAKRKRDDAIIKVGAMEDDMAAHAVRKAETPRSHGTLHLQSNGSYIAPDPPSERTGSDADSDEVDVPPPKKQKKLRDAINGTKLVDITKKGLAASKGPDQENMDIDNDRVREMAKPRRPQPVAIRKESKAWGAEGEPMDVDSDPRPAGSYAGRGSKSKSKANEDGVHSESETWDDEDILNLGTAPAQRKDRKKSTISLEDLFDEVEQMMPATQKVKTVTRPKVKVVLESESEVEIVSHTTTSKPTVVKPGKHAAQSDRQVKATAGRSGKAPVKTSDGSLKVKRQSYQAKEASDDSDEDSGVLADWRRTTHHFTSKSSSVSTPTLTSDTSSRPRSSRARSSTTGRSALSNPWTKVNGDEIIEDSEPEVIVSDRDETQGSEHIAAIGTPPKGKGNRPESKSRLTVHGSSKPTSRPAPRSTISNSITVKTEDRDAPKQSLPQLSHLAALSSQPAKKASSRARVGDLPAVITANGAWKAVTANAIRYLATTADQWTPADRNLVPAVQTLCNTFYEDTEVTITITPKCEAYELIIQRFSDSYRNIIGSTAIACLIAFFDSNTKYRNSDAARKKFANRQYSQYRFMYDSATGSDKATWTGLFRGPFIVQVFAAYFNCISGSTDIPELYREAGYVGTDITVPGPRGALALCGAAVMRAFALFATGSITIETLTAARNAKKPKRKNGEPMKDTKVPMPKLPAMIPPMDTSGKAPVTRTAAFSALGWKKPTKLFYALCMDKITDEELDTIVAEAKALSKISRNRARESAGSDVDPDDSIMQLHNGSGDLLSGNEGTESDGGYS